MMHLGLAIQLLTRFPLKKQFEVTGEDYAKSVAYFPIAALFVGAVMAAAFFAASFLNIPYFAGLVSVVAAYLCTGGFHIDGFADMSDAFFARKSKERTLEILKDSRMGTYGVLAIIIVVAAKVILIGALKHNALLILLATPICGKIPLFICAKLSKYPRETGLGKYIIDMVRTKDIIIALILSVVFLILCIGIFHALIVTLVMMFIGFIMHKISKAKIDGATGDILGASNEAGECIFLMMMVVIL